MYDIERRNANKEAIAKTTLVKCLYLMFCYIDIACVHARPVVSAVATRSHLTVHQSDTRDETMFHFNLVLLFKNTKIMFLECN